MKRILKFTVSDVDVSRLNVPSDAKIVSAGMQGDDVRIWFECRATFLIPREFKVVGTGHKYADDWQHRHTFFDGSFVWHLLERPIT